MKTRTILAAILLALVGCTAEPESVSFEDADLYEDEDGLSFGKSDGTSFTSCELDGIVSLVNDPSTTVDSLRSGCSAKEAPCVHSRAAKNIIKARNGADELPGTADDVVFADATAVDKVSWVGPKALSQLVDAIGDFCVNPGNGGSTPTGAFEVVFSPQPRATSHLARTEALVDQAQHSVDIAMYSFSDAGVRDALKRAVARGVRVRYLSEKANSDRRDPSGSRSAGMEDADIDVRYINKIMHHKFLIIDGPVDDVSQAAGGTLISGSGNLSSGATRYDENTLIAHGNAELNLRFQREFNHLWANSRDFVWNSALQFTETVEITDADIPNDPTVDAAFTSDNFTTRTTSYGRTFSVIRGSNAVADAIVEKIFAAQERIIIASGHLRSRPISEALIAKHNQDPHVEITVYLDGQEFISEWTHNNQQVELEECVQNASTDIQRLNCYDKGFYFGYALDQAGIDVRYKYYAYRWDYSYALQMHHKYFVIDDLVIQGSYNLSDNAEHNTMENMAFIDGGSYPDVVDAYLANFNEMYETGRAQHLYEDLLEDIETGTGSFPIVFESMALSWSQIDRLKRAIRDNCPEINSNEFRRNAPAHRYCDR